jgi:hypothetical protein
MLSRMYGDWVIMLAAAAVAARVTRLATKDTLTEPLRRWIGRRFDKTALDDDAGFWEEFAGCAYCVGWWITIATFGAAYVIWPGHDWSASQLLAWAGAACITNLVQGTIASTTSRVDELCESAELSMYRRRS